MEMELDIPADASQTRITLEQHAVGTVAEYYFPQWISLSNYWDGVDFTFYYDPSNDSEPLDSASWGREVYIPGGRDQPPEWDFHELSGLDELREALQGAANFSEVWPQVVKIDKTAWEWAKAQRGRAT